MGGSLENYFADIRYDPDQQKFVFLNETIKLRGEADLMDRLTRQGAGMFACEIDMEFATAIVQVAVFSGPLISDKTTLRISFDKELTSYLFESEVTAEPFALILERIAEAVESPCFIAGAEYEHWLPLLPGELTDARIFGTSPQVVGWRVGCVERGGVMQALGAVTEWLIESLQGFEMVILIGRHKQRK
jgi:hypothetical protein